VRCTFCSWFLWKDNKHYYCLESCYGLINNKCYLPLASGVASGVQCSQASECTPNAKTLERAMYVCRCGVVICENCNTIESIRAKGLCCDLCVDKALLIAARKAYDSGASAGASKSPRDGS